MNNTSIAEKKSDKNIDKPAVIKNNEIAKNSPARSASVARQPVVARTRTVAIAPTRRPAVKKSAPAPAKTKTILDDKYIVSDAYFISDPKGKYYITSKGHFVQADSNNIYMLGRLAQSNKEGYDLMLSDKHYNYLYIGEGGSIINGAGKKVGYLKVRE